MPEPVFFSTAGEFREWLEANHGRVPELTIGFHRKAAPVDGISYSEALDEALCFGWIDGVRRKRDEQSYTIRFTPRRRGSRWSRVNIRRATELLEAGRMHSAGVAAFEGRDLRESGYSFESRETELSPEYQARFRANERAWAYWESRPPGYRRGAAHWVMSAKQETTRLRRLEALIADSAAGLPIKPLRRNNG